MRKYIILFFLVFPFLFGCHGSDSSGDVIPEDEMIAVLTAVHIADGRLINMSQAPDTLYKYGTARYLAVFNRFHIDSARFRKSYQYYSAQPDKFVDMYGKILKILQAKSDSLNKLVIKESLARAKQQQRQPVKPAVAGPNASYGVGIQPQVPLPAHTHMLTTPARIKAIRDSLNKAHLKNRHALPAK